MSGSVSYSDLCSQQTNADDKSACNTLRAGGAFTLIYGLVALLCAVTLVVKSLLLAFCGLQQKWAEWMATAAAVQTVCLGAAILTWGACGHVVLHALYTDAILSSSWSLTIASFNLSLWTAVYFRSSVQHRPNGEPLYGQSAAAAPMAMVPQQQGQQVLIVQQPYGAGQPQMMVLQGNLSPVYGMQQQQQQGPGQAHVGIPIAVQQQQGQQQQQAQYPGQPHHMGSPQPQPVAWGQTQPYMQQQPQQQYQPQQQMQQPQMYAQMQQQQQPGYEAPPAYTANYSQQEGYPQQQQQPPPPQQNPYMQGQGQGQGAGAGMPRYQSAATSSAPMVWADVTKPK